MSITFWNMRRRAMQENATKEEVKETTVEKQVEDVAKEEITEEEIVMYKEECAPHKKTVSKKRK